MEIFSKEISTYLIYLLDKSEKLNLGHLRARARTFCGIHKFALERRYDVNRTRPHVSAIVTKYTYCN